MKKMISLMMTGLILLGSGVMSCSAQSCVTAFALGFSMGVCPPLKFLPMSVYSAQLSVASPEDRAALTPSCVAGVRAGSITLKASIAVGLGSVNQISPEPY